jgi:pilus assembly protein CpaF
LDALFLDDRVTTISLQGVDKAAVRYGHGELESLGPLFEDEIHLRRIIRRLLLDAGADLQDDLPYIETGLRVAGRPVSISLVTPMMAFGYNADIRVHPKEPLALDDLIKTEFLTNAAVQLLTALAQSACGLVIAGDTESGKTTLLNALLPTLPDPARTFTIERAGELHLPDGMERLGVQWAVNEQPEITFGEQIAIALEQQPVCVVLDEVRADEPLSIGPLLENENAPRQLWSFRGPFDAKRLQNALSMLARRSNIGQGEMVVHALYERLPFIVTLWRAHGQIRLYSIGEWQFRGSDYPDYVLLMDTNNGVLRLTGEQPMHGLNLPADFWTMLDN